MSNSVRFMQENKGTLPYDFEYERLRNTGHLRANATNRLSKAFIMDAVYVLMAAKRHIT